MERIFAPTRDGTHFYIEPLKPDEVNIAAALCDSCVGENLYPRNYLASTLDKSDHFFFFLRNRYDEIAGYIYFHASSFQETAEFLKLSPEELEKQLGGRPERIANMRSISILEPHRKQNLARHLLGWGLEYARSHTGAELAVIVCWKPNGKVPLKRTVESLDFYYLMDRPKFWYDLPELHCPCCQGRCKCDAAVYVKPLRGGHNP